MQPLKVTELAKRKLLVMSTKGVGIIHPLSAEIRRQAKLVVEVAGKLGLTPSERLRLLVPVEKNELASAFGALRVIRGGART